MVFGKSLEDGNSVKLSLKKLLVFYVLIKFMCGPTSQHLGVMI